MRTLGQLMRPDPPKVRADQSVGEVVEMMSNHLLAHVPVVDETGILVALASDFELRQHSRRGELELPVGRVATALPAPPTRDTPAIQALGQQLKDHREATVVVNDQGRPIGIFSEHDALSFARSILRPSTLVGDVCQRGEAPWVPHDAACGAVLSGLLERGERHVLVMQGRKLVGALSHRELVGRWEAPVSSVLGRIVRTARDTDLLTAAIPRLQVVTAGCLPVLNERGGLCGLLTRKQVVRALAMQLLSESAYGGATERVAAPGR